MKVVVHGSRMWDKGYHISPRCNLCLSACPLDLDQLDLALEQDHPVAVCRVTGSSTLRMYWDLELWWFINATWDVLHVKLDPN